MFMRHRRKGSAFALIILMMGLSVGAVMWASSRNLTGKMGSSNQTFDWFGVVSAAAYQSGEGVAAEDLASAVMLREAIPIGSPPILEQQKRGIWRATKKASVCLANYIAASDGVIGKSYGHFFRGFSYDKYNFLIPTYSEQRVFGYGTSAVLVVLGDETELNKLWSLIEMRMLFM